MDALPFKKQLWILGFGAALLFAPYWASHIQQVWGRNLFITPDSIVLLGVTLLVSLLGYHLLPDFVVAPLPNSFRRTPYPVLRSVFIICVLSSVVLLVFVLYWTNQHILHSFLSSADEHSCYFLAECLRKGKLYVDIPPLADFFKVVHVGMRDGKWFSVYPPGWPLIWALGLNLNVVDWLNPIMSSLAIFFFYLAGIRLFNRWAVVCGLLICVFNPFFLFTAASYFSHGTCLLCISIFLYSFLRWREARELVILRGATSQHPVILSEAKDLALDSSSSSGLRMTEGANSEKSEIFWASVCAFAVGYGLMTRYLTMAAVAGPFLLYHFWSCVKNTRCLPSGSPAQTPGVCRVWWHWQLKLRRSDWVFLGTVGVFIALILFQNYLVTGKAFRAPNKHNQSWERLGFRGNFTPLDALFHLVARIFYLMDWFAPAIVAAYLVLIFSSPFGKGGTRGILKNKSPLTPLYEGGEVTGAMLPDPFIKTLFRLSMVFLAGAYFFYYSWGGNQWGPRYLWEGMPFLCIAVADFIIRLWRGGSLRMKKFLAAFVTISLVSSGLTFARQAAYVEESSRQRRALYDLAEKTIQGQGIVFIHGFIGSRLVLAEEDSVRNSPYLDGRILYAHDLGDRNSELMAAYPGRAYFRGTYDGMRKQPILEPLR